ncbi:MAG: hypothetical protein ACFFDI_25540 [Promethearchaeota archaeon]
MMIPLYYHKESELKAVKACFRFSWLGFLIGALCSSIPVIIAAGFLIQQIGSKYGNIKIIIYGALIIFIFSGAIFGGALSGFAREFGPKMGIVGSIIGGIGGITGSIAAVLTGDFLPAIIVAIIILSLIGLIASGVMGVDSVSDADIILGLIIGTGLGFPGASIGTIASYAIVGRLGFDLTAAIVCCLIGGISSLIVGFLCSGGIGGFFTSQECLKRCQRTLPNWIDQLGPLDLESLNDVRGRLAKFVLRYFPTKRERIVSWVKSGKFPPSLQLRENETKLVDVSCFIQIVD